MLQTKFSSGVGTVHFKAIFAGMGGNEPKVVQRAPQKAISSSKIERPMLLTARFPKT
jgi:hypothetical protein